MTDAPIIPRPDQALAPGVDALVALRPMAQVFIDAGRYGDVFALWRAELAVVIQRLVREVLASRLETAKCEALRDLCASAFDTTLPIGPRTAVGNVVLARPSGGRAGVIPSGFRFSRAAKSDTLLPRTQASYTATVDVVLPQGRSSVSVPIVAVRAGAFANTPTGVDSTGKVRGTADIQPADTLFDPTLQVTRSEAAGGSDGTSDDLLKATASAHAAGRYGPTVGAVVAAALLAGGVHVAVLEDPVKAITDVLCLDVSWSSAPAWLDQIQAAADGQGFGCRAAVTGASNAFVSVAASIALRDATALGNPGALTQAVTDAVSAYFTSRPDWYTWRTASLRAVCSRAHPAIKSCAQVIVTDATTGALLSDPPVRPDLRRGTAVHWTLAPGSVQATFTV